MRHFFTPRSGMSLAFVLIVMLLGSALTAAALYVVENATKTTRLAKENAILYAATQEGVQSGLNWLEGYMGGITSTDDIPGRSADLFPGTGDWWKDELSLWSGDFDVPGSSDMYEGLQPTGRWDIYSLQYQAAGEGAITYVQGLPPQVPVENVTSEVLTNETATTTYGQGIVGNPYGGSYLIVSTVTIKRGDGEVKQISSLGLIRTRPKP